MPNSYLRERFRPTRKGPEEAVLAEIEKRAHLDHREKRTVNLHPHVVLAMIHEIRKLRARS